MRPGIDSEVPWADREKSGMFFRAGHFLKKRKRRLRVLRAGAFLKNMGKQTLRTQPFFACVRASSSACAI